MARLGHRKSRTGCTLCKQRRVKCDEQIPCSACVRLRKECSLLSERTPPESTQDASMSPASALAAPGASHATSNPITDDQWALDLTLMNFYTTTTYETLSYREDNNLLWQTVIPAEGRKHHFVFHEALAFTALHMAHLQPESREKCIAAAALHHNRALELLNRVMPNVTPENCTAIFAASSLIALHGFAMSTVATEGNRSLTLDETIEPFLLVRGTASVVLASWEWVSKGPLSEMMKGFGNVNYKLPPEQATRFDQLAGLLDRTCADSSTYKCCQSALENLRTEFARAAGADNVNFGRLFIWFSASDETFMPLIRQRHPMVLLILAQYAVMISKTKGCWWLEGWAVRLTATIEASLDAQWHEWVEWPADYVRGSASTSANG